MVSTIVGRYHQYQMKEKNEEDLEHKRENIFKEILEKNELLEISYENTQIQIKLVSQTQSRN